MHKGLVFTDAEWQDLPQTYGAQVAEMFIKRFRIITLDTGKEVSNYWAFAKDLVAEHLDSRPMQTPIPGFVFLTEDEWHRYTVKLAHSIARQIKDTHQFTECEGDNVGLLVHHLDTRLMAILGMASVNHLENSSRLKLPDTGTLTAKAERMQERAERLLLALAEKAGIYLSEEQGFELIAAEDDVNYHAHGQPERPAPDSGHLMTALDFPYSNEDTALKLLEKRHPELLERIRGLLKLDDPAGAVIVLSSPPQGGKTHIMNLILKDLFERDKTDLITVTHVGHVSKPYPDNAWVKTLEHLTDPEIGDPALGYGQVIVIGDNYDRNALAAAMVLAHRGHKVIFTMASDSLNNLTTEIINELGKQRSTLEFRTLHANNRVCMVFQPDSETQFTL
jgi:hypothetical protein